MESQSELYFRYLINRNLSQKYSQITTEIQDRVHTEYEVIKNAGYIDYFLIVQDIVQYAREQNFLINLRGSAAGSIICYLLDISRVDPLKYGLLFERFLNADRISMPDIDLDIEDINRQKVLEYIEEKYGSNHVCSIAAFNTLKEKILTQDIGRVLNVPYATIENLKKFITEETEIDTLKNNTDFMKAMNDADPRYFDMLERLLGTHRNTTIHAGGIIISNSRIDDSVPLFRSSSVNRNIAQYEGAELELMGYLKIDVLGLKTLGIIKRCTDYILKDTAEIVDVFTIPLDDNKVFDLLNEGKTFGVFQLSGHGFTEFTKQIYVEKFENLVDLLALYRPGCLDSGMANEYIQRKNYGKPYKTEYPAVNAVLANTYGVILYQEQIMQLMQIMGGMNLREADTVRKAISKKDKEAMDTMIGKFKINAYEKFGHAFTDKIVEDIITFARYGFNKSHAVAYAFLTYWTAYLMTNYTEYFITALLNAESERDKQKKIIDHAVKLGIQVLPIDINKSGFEYTMADGKIYTGISSIKNVGDKSANIIMIDREFHGEYSSYDNFCERLKSTTITVKKALIIANAFSKLHQNKLWLYNNAKVINAKATGKKTEMAENLTLSQLATLEFEYTGQQSSEEFTEELEYNFHVLGINNDNNYVGGVVTNVHEITTSKGDRMAFVTLKADQQRSVTVFPDLYKIHSDILECGKCLIMSIQKKSYQGKISLVAQDIKNYDEIIVFYKSQNVNLK